jgi:hypothetical protein
MRSPGLVADDLLGAVVPEIKACCGGAGTSERQIRES